MSYVELLNEVDVSGATPVIEGDSAMMEYTADELREINSKEVIFSIVKAFQEDKCRLDGLGQHVLYERYLWVMRFDAFVLVFEICVNSPDFKLTPGQDCALKDAYKAYEANDWDKCRLAMVKLFEEMPEDHLEYDVSVLPPIFFPVWMKIMHENGWEPDGQYKTPLKAFALRLWQESFIRASEDTKHKHWHLTKNTDPDMTAAVERYTADMDDCMICNNAKVMFESNTLPIDTLCEVTGNGMPLEEAFAEYPMCRIG